MASTSSTPIQELRPDYVLSVSYPLKDGTPVREAEDEYRSLIEKLYRGGFSTQVRPGTASLSELLVFIKLSSSKFSEESEKDLVKSYEFGVTNKSNTAASRLRIVFQYLTTKTELGGLGISVSKNWKYLKNIVPVTQALDSGFLQTVQSHILPTKLTTATIKEQFGVRIALYFEFLKTYTTWLIFLATAGFATHFTRTNGSFSLSYAFVNLIWGILFITYWGKKQNDLVNSWGVQNSHLVEENNAELALLNERQDSGYVSSKINNIEGGRFIKQLAFVPIALGFTATLVGFQLSCFVLEIFLSEIYDGPGKSLLTLLPTVMISVFVPILTIAYKIVTTLVIEWENHGNIYSRENSIVAKSFVLTFLTSYMPLIITSFIYLPFAHLIELHLGDIKSTISSNVNNDYFFYKYLVQLKKQENFKINQQRLSAQFFYFVVTNQIIQLILKYALPLVISKVVGILNKSKNVVSVPDKPSEAVWLSRVRKTVSLAEYNVNDDFRGIIVQYGYLIIFGAVWPLAPFVNIVFNLITFKLDTLKLSSGQYFRPPIPVRVDSVHPWDHALFILTWIGSVVSPVVTSFYRHGVAPPKTLGQFALDKASVNVSSTVKLILVVFAAEHAFFILYFVASKVAKLFKSDAELNNDFVANDIKLRRDYYGEKFKQGVSAYNDGEWANFSASSTLEESSTLVKRSQGKIQASVPSEKVSSTKPTASSKSLTSEVENIPSTPVGYSSSADSELNRSLDAKKQALYEKQAELEKIQRQNREGLNKIKEQTDNVVAYVDKKGSEVLSTIDDNKHAEIVPPIAPGVKEALDEKMKKETHSLDLPQISKSEVSSASGVSTPVSQTTDNSYNEEIKDDAKKLPSGSKSASESPSSVSRKKSTLKKLFKNKK